MTPTIAEIFEGIAKHRGALQKIEAVKRIKNKTALRILQYTYVPSIEFVVPNTPPPYKPFLAGGLEGALTGEYRRLEMFVKGNPKYVNASRMKLEAAFINMLENVDPVDAKILLTMISKKKIKGITRSVVKAAFPEWFVNETDIADDEEEGETD